MNTHPLENPFAAAFRRGSFLLVVLLAASLSIFVSPLLILATILGFAAVWMIFRFPTSILGAVLAFAPIDYMVIEFGKLFKLPAMSVVSACTKEVPLLLLLLILGRRNGLKLATPDWFVLGLLILAVLRTLLDGSLLNLVTDFQFVIPYAIGRVAVLSSQRQCQWAKRAVWIVAILSVLGMIEIFVLGSAPRTFLYLATEGSTEGGRLTASFFGAGFAGMREASTMVGPPNFGALCMIAMILWWVYARNPVPAAMIAAGLMCSVTRSAWIGSAVAISLLGILMNQTKRLMVYFLLGIALFIAAIPTLGLRDYLFLTKTGQDPSAESHRDSILGGLDFIAGNPFGGGNIRVGPRPAEKNGNALLVETTDLAFGAEYGVLALICFVGFMLSALRLVWPQHSQLGYAAVGILVGLGLAMSVLLLHDDRRLACWEWFPVGLAVRSAVNGSFSGGGRLAQAMVESPES